MDNVAFKCIAATGDAMQINQQERALEDAAQNLDRFQEAVPNPLSFHIWILRSLSAVEPAVLRILTSD